MASPMAVAVMTKKALELAEDKRVRTLLACNRDADAAAGYGFYLQYTSRIQSGGGKNRIRWRTHSNGYRCGTFQSHGRND